MSRKQVVSFSQGGLPRSNCGTRTAGLLREDGRSAVHLNAETGEQVAEQDVANGYKVDASTYIEVKQNDLDAVEPQSARTIEIEEFVPRSEVDCLYFIRSYYVLPDGTVGHDAFAVIRETIRALDKAALARVTLANRERIVALEARDEGMVGTLLRYPYEVRGEDEHFEEIRRVKVTKDMIDLAKHIVEQKSGSFDPSKFEDYHKDALIKLLAEKQGAPTSNVINLLDALKKSLAAERKTRQR